MDPVGPALSERPLLIREIVPYADRRSSQFQEVVDDLVQQDRLVPGQLERLLRLTGAGSVLRADRRQARAKRRARSGTRRAGALGGALAAAPGTELRPAASGWFPRAAGEETRSTCRRCAASGLRVQATPSGCIPRAA